MQKPNDMSSHTGGIYRIIAKFADQSTPGVEISRLITVELGEIMKNMVAPEESLNGGGRAAKDIIDLLKAYRMLHGTFMIEDVLSRKVEDADFDVAFTAILGYFRMAMIKVRLPDRLDVRADLQFSDLVTTHEERLQRATKKIDRMSGNTPQMTNEDYVFDYPVALPKDKPLLEMGALLNEMALDRQAVIKRITKMLADPDIPAIKFSRFIGLAIATVIAEMVVEHAKDSLTPCSRRTMKNKLGLIIEYRNLHRTLTERRSISREDFLDLDGPLFRSFFRVVEELGCQAMRDVAVPSSLRRQVMIEFEVLAKTHDAELRRKIKAIHSNT